VLTRLEATLRDDEVTTRGRQVEDQRNLWVLANLIQAPVCVHGPAPTARLEACVIRIPRTGPLKLRMRMSRRGVEIGYITATHYCASHADGPRRNAKARSTFTIASRISSMSSALPRKTELAM
jgi:hypothetical protein